MHTIENEATLDLTIESLAVGGRGVAHADGMAVFVDGGLPGQRVLARVCVAHKRFAEAEIVETLAPSPHQTAPACSHFGVCGGCCWQHLDYAQQLRWKRSFVEESFRRLAGIVDIQARPTLGSPLQYGYRNKMEFSFGGDPAGRLLLGLHHRAGAELVEVTDCRLQSARCMEIVEFVRERCRKAKPRSYDPEKQQGYWRFLVVRESGDQCLIQIITTDVASQHAAVDELAAKLQRRFPTLIGVVHALRQRPSQFAQGESLRRVYGADSLRYELAGLTLDVAANAFFKPNSGAAALLYQTVRDLADLRGGETIWDLYCGVGGFGMLLAKNASHAVGFEIEPTAVEKARGNARANGVAAMQFRAGDLTRTLAAESSVPDLVVADPPRAGMDQAVVKLLLKRRPTRILYVSCDPATQARDAQRLLAGYTLTALQPVDLFPHTAHVENVALFVRREAEPAQSLPESSEELPPEPID